jgi:hypothetical protein
MGTADTATGWRGEIRRAGAGDAQGVAALAAELAQSFAFSPERFRVNYPALLAADGACLLVALATRRAAPFYRALGYEESATYFRKVAVNQARP